ncbi:bbp-1 [Symbiodinium sp. CCMP2592]|nr:bbp-1 [Symbiodinium sp. CCMP2592]
MTALPDDMVASDLTSAIVLAGVRHEETIAAFDDGPKRRSRWSECKVAKKGKRWGLPDDKPYKPLSYVDLPMGLSEKEIDQFLREQRLEDLHRKIQAHELEDVDPDIRPPSPPPVYDKGGNRLNTRDVRIRKGMTAEYNRLIRYMIKHVDGYLPPVDWKPAKLMKKIIIPIEKFPQAPFMGVIIGPRGVNHKRLQDTTGCKIFIRGRDIGDKWQTDEEAAMPQHVHIEGETEEQQRARVICPACLSLFTVPLLAMPCRVGVVGAGPLVGRAHCLLLKRLAADDDVELACICQRRADDTALAEQLQVPLYVDAKEMACQEALDGVVIAAPTHLHLALTQACIEGTKLRREEGRGGTLKALLIEKPICHDLQSAAELLSVTDSAGVVVLVGHQRRHSRLVKRARQVVTDQDFGPLRGVNMEFSLLKPDSYFCKDDPALEWRRRKGVGGPILINTIHDLDLMRFITGHEITKVFAMTSSAARGEEVEDSGGITVTFDHGAVGTLFFTDAAPAPWSYEFTTGENKKYPPVPGNDMRDCYHFMGAQRSLGFPSLHDFSYRGAAERGWDAPLTVEQPVVQTEDPLLLQMNHFVRVCRGEEIPVCSGRDAVESLAVVLAVQRSAECGRAVAPSELLAEVNKDAVSACRLDSSLLPISKEPAACSAETTTARAGRKRLETVTESDLASPQSA